MQLNTESLPAGKTTQAATPEPANIVATHVAIFGTAIIVVFFVMMLWLCIRTVLHDRHEFQTRKERYRRWREHSDRLAAQTAAAIDAQLHQEAIRRATTTAPAHAHTPELFLTAGRQRKIFKLYQEPR